MNISKKILSVILTSLFCVFFMNAQTYSNLSYTSKKQLSNEGKTSVTIKCNVENAEVYFNNRYQGRTDFTLTSLAAGTYKMEVRKKGYQTAYYSIKVRSGYSLVYDVVLEKEFGYVSLLNLPVESSVFVDDESISDRRFKLDIGNHSLLIRKFGFKDISYNLNIKAYETIEIDVDLKPAAFEISGFELSRDLLNPNYSGSLSKTDMSFSVSADGEVIVYVKDETGDIKWSATLNNFYTWKNYITWNGTDSEGKLLPDGNYIAGIKTVTQYSEVPVKIDSGLALPLVGFTADGTAIGSVPMAYHSETSFIMPFISYKLNTCFGENQDVLAPSPVTGGILWGLGRWGEAGFSIQGYTFADEFVLPIGFNALFRATCGFEMGQGSDTYWNFTFITRYGLSTVPQFAPYGVDNGNGFGIGLASGIDSRKLYGGLACEFIQGAGDGDLSIRNYVVKTGLAFDIKPANTVNIGLWTTLYSASGIYEDFGTVKDETYFCRGIEGGVELKACPGSTGFIIKTGLNCLYIINSNVYISADLCLSYLF